MQEKIAELYEQYLTEKLNLIFQNSGDKIIKNPLLQYELEIFYKKYTWIEKNCKENFVDSNNNPVSEIWYDVFDYFYDGYAAIKQNGKWNFIDTKGNLISKEWYDEINIFSGGYAAIKQNGKWNFIDTKGNLISKEWYDKVYDFENGYAMVKQNDKYNFIDTNGKLVNEVWFEQYRKYINGYAMIVKNEKINYIDIKGNLISEKWYDELYFLHLGYFKNGYAIVKKDEKYNFIDTSGNLISDEWYDLVWGFEEGYARVEQNGKHNFIDTNGKLISKDWFNYSYPFSDGFGKVKKGQRIYLISKQGTLIDCDEVKRLNDDYFIIKKNKRYNFIDESGKLLSKTWYKNFYSFLPEYHNYKIAKTILGYKCENEYNSFKIKYEPYYIFNPFFVLCSNNNKSYLYNKLDDTYTELGECKDIYIIDNIIFNISTEKAYLINKNKLLDITNYFNDNLSTKDVINIAKVDTNILTKEEFFLFNYEKIDELIKEAKIERKQEEEKRNAEKKHREVEKEKQQLEIAEKEKEERQLKLLKSVEDKFVELQKNIEELESINSSKIKKNIVKIDNLFIRVDDHLEISPVLIDKLKYIDLGMIDFTNVKMSGIDFSDCVLSFNPQKVYNKDLRNSDFTRVFISPFADFTGVDIRGCKFSTDDDPKTLDTFNICFEKSIYDETTTYNGISFTEIFNKKTEQKSK